MSAGKDFLIVEQNILDKKCGSSQTIAEKSVRWAQKISHPHLALGLMSEDAENSKTCLGLCIRNYEIDASSLN